MVRVDLIEMNKQDMIDICAKLINGKCLEVGRAVLHVGKVVLRDDHGGVGVAIGDSLRIFGVKLPFIVVDCDWHILVAKAG